MAGGFVSWLATTAVRCRLCSLPSLVHAHAHIITTPRRRRNYTGVLQARGVGRADVEQYIRTQLSFSAGCCRDACRFSYNLCGCEGGVVTLAMRLMGDETIFGVLLQQMGLACGERSVFSCVQELSAQLTVSNTTAKGLTGAVVCARTWGERVLDVGSSVFANRCRRRRRPRRLLYDLRPLLPRRQQPASAAEPRRPPRDVQRP